MWTMKEAENYTELGGSVKVFTNAVGSQNMELAVGQFKPGEGLKCHYHKSPCEELYFVYKGEGTVYMGSDEIRVRAGNVLYIPPEVEHRVVNTGQEVLEIVFITSPIQKEPMVVVE